MKYKIIVVSIFSMLMIGSAFGSASVINSNTTNNNDVDASARAVNVDSPEFGECSFGDPFIVITDPELGYIYLQIECGHEALKGDESKEVLETLNLAVYVTFCNQLFLDTYHRDCPDDSIAKFSLQNWWEDEQYHVWDNDSSDGFNAFIPFPQSDYVKILKDISVKVYDSDGNLLTSDTLPNNVLYIYLPTSD